MPDHPHAENMAGRLYPRLADFIRQNLDTIVAEWINFARRHVPAGSSMTDLALQDHIHEILGFIAEDLESPQTARQQVAKSKGDGPKATRLHDSAAEVHAALRLKDGFNIDQMVSEYRALRASVVKLWTAQKLPSAETDVNDLTRFNEAVDQSFAESVAEYTSLIDQSRNIFLGIIGHDLRNPMGAAFMAGEMLKRLSPPDTKQNLLASQIVETTQRGLQILNDLLDITRSAFGADIPVVKAPMDIGEVGAQLVNEMRALSKGRTIALDIAGETSGAFDRGRIGQVFSNLIGNAIEYSLPESTITVRVAGQTDQVVVSVHNEGSPIPAEKLARIFEALTRGLEPHEGQQGSSHLGLGLFIAKRIVMAHGGDMSVTSSAESGTIFTVQLPRT